MDQREFMKAAYKAEFTYYHTRAWNGTAAAERALQLYLVSEQTKNGMTYETANQIFCGIVKEDKFAHSEQVLN